VRQGSFSGNILSFLLHPFFLASGKHAFFQSPSLALLPFTCSILFVEYADLMRRPREVTASVLEFIGADPSLLRFAPGGSGVAAQRNEGRGRRMHPSVTRKLRAHYTASNLRLGLMIGKDLASLWGREGGEEAASKESGGAVEGKAGGGAQHYGAQDRQLVRRVVSVTAASV
jgi:hypothetical protein